MMVSAAIKDEALRRKHIHRYGKGAKVHLLKLVEAGIDFLVHYVGWNLYGASEYAKHHF